MEDVMKMTYANVDGDGPAGPPVPREPFKRAWTDRNVLLLGIGDSVTAGFGARPGYSYWDRLIMNPTDEFPDMRGVCLSAVMPNIETRNVSVSYSDSFQHLRDQITPLPTFDEDTFGVVCVTTGGNDLIHSYGMEPPREGAMFGSTWEQAQPWIAAWEIRLQAMLTEIQRRFQGGVEIYIGTIFDPSDGQNNYKCTGLPHWPDLHTILGAYNRVIRTVAAHTPGVHIVDIHSAFLGHGISDARHRGPADWEADPDCWYLSNVEDPNERGYDVLRRLFLNEIVRRSALCPQKLGPGQTKNIT